MHHDFDNFMSCAPYPICYSLLQDDEGRWNKYGGRLPWDTSAICCNNPTFGGTGNHKTGEDYVAAPNIDHTQEFVRKDIIKWLKLLRSIGFDGFRFDFVKGYSVFHLPLCYADLRGQLKTPTLDPYHACW